MAGKLYKTGESFSLDSDSSKQSLCAHLGKLMSSRTSTPVHWRELGPPAFSMEAFGHAKEFSSEREADCFCSLTGSSVTRDKESQQATVRQGEQYLTFCWATNPQQGKAWRPEPDWQGFRWSWGQTPKSEPYAGTESQMPGEHRANLELTEFVTLLLWVLNDFEEVDFFLTFF